VSGGYRMLLFGSSGAIGSAIAKSAANRGWHITGAVRPQSNSACETFDFVHYDVDGGFGGMDRVEPFDAVCWAQGANMVDSPASFDCARHLELYRANCLSIMDSLFRLLDMRLLRDGGARLCAISSIWQERARSDKFSYTVTKAAVGGIVRAASVDLGSQGHLFNGVLPGVLDTPMTRANLTPEQIERVSGKTSHDRLPDLDTLVATVLFLLSPENRSISGQSVTVDLGFSNTCLI